MKNIITKSKIRIGISILVTCTLILLSSLAAMHSKGHAVKLVLCIMISLAAGALISLNVQFPKLLSILFLIMIPFFSLIGIESFTHEITDIKKIVILLNLVFYYLLYAICSSLLNSIKWGYVLATLIPLIFGVINFFVIQFRSSPLMPWDFLAARTALSITDNYSFTFDYRFVFLIFGFAYLMICAEKIQVKIKNLRIRLAVLLFSSICMAGYVTVVKSERTTEVFKLYHTLFAPKRIYMRNGFAVAFITNFRYLHIQKPEDYTPKEAEEIMSESNVQVASAASTNKKTSKDKPNIIVIMNEAFSDLSVRGKFETNEDYMPFIHSLTENTIKSDMFVSVKGGNTANTEYEFLTSDTMAFLPSGSVAYQQFVRHPMPALPNYLKSLGYKTTAIHPYNSKGWNRENVYSYFGFDTYFSKTDFKKPKKIRDYISDESAFQKIIEIYENKAKDERIFTFEVTMQNHGGYDKEFPGFEPTITLSQYADKKKSDNVRAAEQYLTLIKESDKAFQELTDYFKKESEPTIIVMFGDHQPADNVAKPILKLNHINQDASVEEYQNGYIVPMVMWANYKLENQDIPMISPNYLSGLLLSNAGLPLTDYQSYLEDLRKTIPVITANVYIDKDGNYHQYSEDSFKEQLNQYSILQYNHLSDYKNRVNDFFGG